MTSLPVAQLLSIPHPSNSSDAHTSDIYHILLSKNVLFSCSSDHSVRAWDIDTQCLLLPPLIGHHSSVLCLASHTTQDILASADADGIVIIWEISTGRLLRKWKAHDEAVLCLASSGKALLTGSRDGTVKLWDEKMFVSERYNYDHFCSDPILLQSLNLNTPVLAIASDEELMQVFVGGGNGSISQWDLASGQLSLEFPEADKRGGISSLTLISRGKCLVSGSSDGNIRLFDALSGAELECFRAHANVVRSLQSIPSDPNGGNENIIVSGSYDGTCSTWKKDSCGKWSLARTVSYERVLQSIEEDKSQTGNPNGKKGFRIFSVVLKGNKVFCSGQGPYILAWPVNGLPELQ